VEDFIIYGEDEPTWLEINVDSLNF